MLATVSLTLTSLTGSAIADEPPSKDCVSSQDASWLCKGDSAWADGYLVAKSKMRELFDKVDLLAVVLEERDGFRELADKMQGQRDAYKEQSEAWKALSTDYQTLLSEVQGQRDGFEEELVIVEEKLLAEQTRAAELQAQVEGNWSPLEVGLLTGGVAVLSVLGGVGVYAMVVEFR